jgi:hypothetical protein
MIKETEFPSYATRIYLSEIHVAMAILNRENIIKEHSFIVS